MNKGIQWKNFLISIAISVGTGLLAAVLTRGSMMMYEGFVKPPLSPPAWLFPIVWTILYILMGISAYIIYESPVEAQQKEKVLSIYGFQLFFNFLWSIVFFNFNNYLLAIGIILILWGLIIAMIVNFNKINKVAGWLQVPYLLWVTFATYLNIAIYFLNQ
ncbi:MAG: tryptophan-rich sensory protein [Cellulosilyticum sp.]|nr:tryptophan-rich sensory protein [Cellulosilyticum sp.]